ncbi:hypothetical protein B4099_2328 [Heyndrickxia coagulans]|uniref:Uncharacterized protein n=1 Tax=Heyndrickxia coagulans TaxID=1398 RepID=A0A150KHZ5_HEYCO|nr:hypothetical protein B4099_2328 [Heyndrickxia coagulans]
MYGLEHPLFFTRNEKEKNGFSIFFWFLRTAFSTGVIDFSGHS